MSQGLPDTTGYPLEAAREMLSVAGASEVEIACVGRDEEPGGDKRSMVIRQRSAGEGAAELTVALEWRTPMRAD